MNEADAKAQKRAKKERKLAKKVKKKEKKLKKKIKKQLKKLKNGKCSSSSSSSSSSAPAEPAALGKSLEADHPKPHVALEPTRESTGLRLFGDLYAQAKPHSELRWDYPLRDESRRCYAGLLRPKLSEGTLRHFEQLVRDGAAWHQPKRLRTGEVLPRKTDWMTAERCRCAYRYSGVEVDPTEFPPWMMEVMETFMPFCGIRGQGRWPNCCNLNLYEDGGMSVGWHADDEELFQGKVNDCPIISLSLGHTRTFELQLSGGESCDQAMHRVQLQSGDIMTMEGLTQKHYLHRVPREKALGPRINLTWRWIRKHQARCPLSR